jgi:hypothetical protein
LRAAALLTFVRSVTEVGHRDLFKNHAEIDGTFRAEGTREAPLRTLPERTAFRDSGPSGGSQRGDTAAAILLGHVEPHEAALLEWTQEVAERRAIHDEQSRKILNRAWPDVGEPGQDGVLVHAQARGRESIVVESRDAPRRLAKG